MRLLPQVLSVYPAAIPGALLPIRHSHTCCFPSVRTLASNLGLQQCLVFLDWGGKAAAVAAVLSLLWLLMSVGCACRRLRGSPTPMITHGHGLSVNRCWWCCRFLIASFHLSCKLLPTCLPVFLCLKCQQWLEGCKQGMTAACFFIVNPGPFLVPWCC